MGKSRLLIGALVAAFALGVSADIASAITPSKRAKALAQPPPPSAPPSTSHTIQY